MQESNYRLKTKGCYTGLRKETKPEVIYRCENEHKDSFLAKDACLKEPKRIESRICMDFGISQIYYKTAKAKDLDIDKLLQDIEYSLEAGAKVLAEIKKRFENRELDWYLRYNCGWKKNINRDTCQIYKKLVQRYL